MRLRVMAAAWTATVVAGVLLTGAASALTASRMVADTGLTGGLIVCIDANPTQVAALGARETFVVRALCRDAGDVAVIRDAIRAEGRYGRVSADVHVGARLPYVDNLVNLLVDNAQESRLPDAEVLRVLAPGGVAFRGNGRKLSKPWPDQIDEWPHYLHNSAGNPVAQDDAVRPPQQIQWIAPPAWARHHEHMASMNALVSAGGRVFAICDEGPMASMLHPPRWRLTARDAFNGVLLWQRPIDEWFHHLHPLKNGPASLPRRLVAGGERVYVTLGIQAPVSVLDAATGKTVQVLHGTEATREIVLSGDRLFLVRGDGTDTAVTAVDAHTGEILWNKPQRVVALSLAVDADRVVFLDRTKVIALEPETGTLLWAAPELPEKNWATWLVKNPPRLILTEQLVVVGLTRSVYAVSTEDGRLLWKAPYPRSGYVSPKDLFVIDGLVWYGDTATGNSTGRFDGRDLLTGEVKRSFTPDIDAVWLSHHRCHFSKATRNFILPGRMGTEFVELKTEKWTANHWARGGCIYGVMPCNGLLYIPPHACACYFESKLNGFTALTGSGRPGRTIPEDRRLERGEAYGETIEVGAAETVAGDWPTLRCDAARSGSADTCVAVELAPQWQVELGGVLTQPVVAQGRVFVCAKDRHTLHALDMHTGESLWACTVGGRIDSPPTIYNGRAIFGGRDGWVTCVRAADGAVVWRYRAFPHESLIMVRGQLESAWPVNGSVLIQNGEVHCVAGRNMFLDGGLRYLRLDPVTGKSVSETIMDQTDPLQGGTIRKYDSWLDMTTTLPDVLASDGRTVTMRSLPFDLQGRRRRITHIAADHEAPHVFSPTGFLDGQWFHRSYWTYARTFPGGWIGHLNAGRYNPSGRLLVVDGATIYGFGRKPQYYKWTTALEYRLFAVDKHAHKTRDIYAYDRYKAAQLPKFPQMKIDRQLGLPSGNRPRELKSYACKWEVPDMPVLVTAMVATENALFVAGPRDVCDEGQLFFRGARGGAGKIAQDVEKQAAEWQNGRGLLLAVAKEDGRILAEHQLATLPVFDGMVAARNRLFVATKAGRLVCLGNAGKGMKP